MHADVSRSTFRPERHYSAVVAQQGRVQLDADTNEQTAIQLHQLRSLARDLIGRHGGPADATGFAVRFVGGRGDLDDLSIGGGRYYVDGVLCDADRPRPGAAVDDDGRVGDPDADPPAHWTYWDQPDGHRDPERPSDRLPAGFPFLAYLRVWERTVTAAEDPALREVALGSAVPDTAARTKVVWQVLPLAGAALEVEDGADKPALRAAFDRWAARAAAPGCALAARGQRPEHTDDDPCLVAPDARYRGPENQLYRVQVHQGGPAGEATFVWSRENGSVVFPIDELDGTWAVLASLGDDDKLDLHVGDWVECQDTAASSRREPLPLLRVEEIDLPGRRVRLSGEPAPGVGRRPQLRPFLRRWDQRPVSRRGKGRAAGRLRQGAVVVEEGRWLPLEDGVEVVFQPGGHYRSGDYWLIPARTATGGVEWPTNAARRPLLQPPAGVRVHYAPLGWVLGEESVVDLRLAFPGTAVEIPAADARALAAEAEAEAEAEAAAAADREGDAEAPAEGG